MALATATLYAKECDDVNDAGVPMEVNGVRGQRFENSFVQGEILFLQRPDPERNGWAHQSYFAAKSRRFEMRCQLAFKQDPGDVFFAAEFAHPTPLTWTTRSIANWVVSVFQMLSAAKGVWFTYALDRTQLPNGDSMRPHCAFPIIATEAVCVTPYGETPPPITEPLPESTLAEKLSVQLNTQDTYTFAYWNANLDFARWQLVNMPFGWSSPLEPFIGEQAIELRAYSLLTTPEGSVPHADKTKRTIVRLVVEKHCPGHTATQQASDPMCRHNRSILGRAGQSHGSDLIDCNPGSGSRMACCCIPVRTWRKSMERARARRREGAQGPRQGEIPDSSMPAKTLSTDQEDTSVTGLLYWGIIVVPAAILGTVIGLA